MKGIIKDIIFLLVIIGLILKIVSGNQVIEKTIIEQHTDTLYIDKPLVDTCYITKYITKYLPTANDTTKKEEVVIPITTKVYKDSTYEAKISGFKPELDYIKVYPKTYTIYKEKLVKSPKNKFNWGLQLGVGYGIVNKKPDIYLGIGMQYNF